MEKDNIGTKATRSDIISTLFKRNYIRNISTRRIENIKNQRPRQAGALGIEATEIGFQIIQSMRNYVPEILSSDLTRFTEVQINHIESGTMKSVTVLENTSKKLNEALVSFKKKEIEIGHHLAEAITMTRMVGGRQETIIGSCPVCKDGHLKIIRSSTKKRFVGCSNYTSGKCKAAAPVPQNGPLWTTGNKCSVCSWPILMAPHFVEVIFGNSVSMVSVLQKKEFNSAGRGTYLAIIRFVLSF
jgi:DNA topoisomerase I